MIEPISLSSSSISRRNVEPNTGNILLFHNYRDRESNVPNVQKSATTLFDDVETCIDKTLSQLREKIVNATTTFSIIGIGFSTFCMNLIGVNHQNQLISNEDTMSYACNSPEISKECQTLKSKIGLAGAKNLYKRTGTPIHSCYALPQLRHHYKKLSTLAQQTSATKVHKWQTIGSICLSRWIAKDDITSDESSSLCLPFSLSEASWTGLLNYRTCEWDEEAVKLLPKECIDALPPISSEMEIFYKINSAYGVRWPEMQNHCRFFLGMGDGACANVGSKCSTSKRIAVTIGTSAAARICLPCPILNCPQSSLDKECVSSFPDIPLGLFCYRISKYHILLGGALTDGGSVIEWARSLLNLLDDDAFNECMSNITAKYATHLSLDKTRCDDTDAGKLTCVPFLSGERSTGFRTSASGCISGFNRNTTPSLFLGSCLEGVTTRIGVIIDLILCVAVCCNNGEKDCTIITSGTALQHNKVWRQMIADCTGKNVMMDESATESTSRGVVRFVAFILNEGTNGNLRSDLAGFDDKEEQLYAIDICRSDSAMNGYWKEKILAQEELITAISPVWQ
mmetsp:Transcript_48489/g.56669  ORF Transcript_48489/g.56669 Transcript_48489/m.56669 type:complete len:568 (+) Transcript_48489:886-2589(+)